MCCYSRPSQTTVVPRVGHRNYPSKVIPQSDLSHGFDWGYFFLKRISDNGAIIPTSIIFTQANNVAYPTHHPYASPYFSGSAALATLPMAVAILE
jgi:hypothetical protein